MGDKVTSITPTPENPYKPEQQQQAEPDKPKRQEKRTRLLVQIDLSDHEIAKISKEQQRSLRSIGDLEKQLSSVKADFKAQIERAEQDVANLSRRISDGFEMRECECVVRMHDPEVGRKTTYRYGDDSELIVVKDEAMTYAERQEKLFPDEEVAEEEPTTEAEPSSDSQESSEIGQEPTGVQDEEAAGEEGDGPEDEAEPSAEELEAEEGGEEPQEVKRFEVSEKTYGATVIVFSRGSALEGQVFGRISDQTLDPYNFDAPEEAKIDDVLEHGLEHLVRTCRDFVSSNSGKRTRERAGAALASWGINQQKELTN